MEVTPGVEGMGEGRQKNIKKIFFLLVSSPKRKHQEDLLP